MTKVYSDELIDQIKERMVPKTWDGASAPEKKAPTLAEQVAAIKMIPNRDRSHEDWRFLADNQFKVKQ